MTDLRAAAGEYLAIRRALGFTLRGHDRLLEDFIAFLAEAGASAITTAAAAAWATRPAGLQPVRYAQRLCVIRGFTAYLHAFDATVEVPPIDLLPYRRWRRTPYLYSQTDIDALITATDLLRPALRAATYRALFGLLAVTRMRVGEAMALDDADVDLDAGVLVINTAKFGNYAEGAVMPSPVTVGAAYGDSAQDSSA
jgi:integrase